MLLTLLPPPPWKGGGSKEKKSMYVCYVMISLGSSQNEERARAKPLASPGETLGQTHFKLGPLERNIFGTVMKRVCMEIALEMVVRCV